MQPEKFCFKTLCTRCLAPIDCEFPAQMTWVGEVIPTREYIANALRSKNVWICCDDCMEKMPDVNLEDLKIQ